MIYVQPIFKYENNKRTLKFNHYMVEEKNKNHVNVYMNGMLITSRTSFKSACKVAKLLEEAYVEGYNDGSY